MEVQTPVIDRPTVANAACTHPVATHYHGSHACYVFDKCRCIPCREANTAYMKKRSRWTGEFPYEPPPLVDSAETRNHVVSLMDQGMGAKRVAAVAGVTPSLVGNIVYGRGGNHHRAANRIRRSTAEKLLAVTLDVSDGAKVDATESWQIIDELVARGWWKAAIGRRVHGPGAISLQVSRNLVFAGTLRTLRTLLTEPVPLRLHNVTGKMYDPTTSYEPQFVEPVTPGVPVAPQQLLAWDRIRLWETVQAAQQHHRRVFV